MNDVNNIHGLKEYSGRIKAPSYDGIEINSYRLQELSKINQMIYFNKSNMKPTYRNQCTALGIDTKIDQYKRNYSLNSKQFIKELNTLRGYQRDLKQRSLEAEILR